MRAVGVDGAEVTVNPDLRLPVLFDPAKTYSIATPESRKMLAEELRRHGKRITAFCLHSRFDERPEQEIELTITTARAAAELGAPAVRLDMVPRKINDLDAFLNFAVDTGRKIVEGTGDIAVRFGVENHGPVTNRPDFLRRLFDGVGSKRFGLTLDVGNFYWFGHPLSKVYDLCAEFAPWTCHVHCKNIRYPQADRERQRDMGHRYADCRCPIDEGDIDYARFAQVLRQHGYRGDLCIDDESLGTFPKDQRGAILKRQVGFLQRIASP